MNELKEQDRLYKFASKKGMSGKRHWMTIGTSTYQREATIGRAYLSLLNLRLPVVGGASN